MLLASNVKSGRTLMSHGGHDKSGPYAHPQVRVGASSLSGREVIIAPDPRNGAATQSTSFLYPRKVPSDFLLSVRA